MKVLVTGSSGFIGSHLCRALTARGEAVRAFHRATSNLHQLEDLPVEHAVGDLTRQETIEAAMQGVDVVFHVAAMMGGSSQAGRAYAVTVEGTRSVLAAARRAGVRRVVHTSTVATLGVPLMGMRLTENSTFNLPPNTWPYAYAKYLAEQEVQKAVAQGLDVVIVNPSYVLGRGDIYRQAQSLVVLVANNRLPALVEGGLNVVHIDDVVAGHLAALARGKAGERYLLGGENLTIEALVRLIARVANASVPAILFPGPTARRLGRAAHLLGPLLTLPVETSLFALAGYNFWLDTTRSQSELVLDAPRSAEQSVSDAYNWFVETGAIRRSHSSSG